MSDDVGTSPDGYAGKATSGFFWTTAQKWVGRIAGLVTIVILTRLLSPEDFGLVAIALSVVPFIYLLADLGFSTYLIQAENPKARSFSTAFWYSTVAGLLLAVGFVALGPLLELIIDAPGIAGVMTGFAPAVVFVALGSVPMAILRRRMRFKLLAIQAFAGGIFGQAVAVVLALSGAGVWALVAQTVATQFISVVLVWAYAKWHPSWMFDWQEFRAMVRFGVNVVSVEVVALTRLWAENAIIAATLGLTGLGYLSIAQRLIQVAQDLTASAITPVSTVVFAQIRADRSRLAGGYLRAQAVIYAIIVPVMIFVSVGAPDIIPILFGDGWEPSIAPAQALAIAGVLTVGAALDLGLFYALGRPGLWLVYSIVIDAITVLTTLLLVRQGLFAVTIGFVGVALVATIARCPLVALQVGVRPIRLFVQFGRALALAALTGAAGVLVAVLSDALPEVASLVLVGSAISLTWLALVAFVMPEAAADLKVRLMAVRSRIGHRRRDSV
jgi:O-antigen/teichoic acid export membrane protein